VGGIGVLVYLVARAKSTCISLRLCHSLWRYDHLSTKEMLRIQGFDLLGKFLRTNECILDDEILLVVWQIVCTFIDRKTGSEVQDLQKGVSKNGIVTNVHALKMLILDWRIWQRASPQVQESLFGNMASLLQNNPHYEVNVEQFRQAGALDQLLFMFQEQETYPNAVVKPLITVLKSLLHKVPTSAEVHVCARPPLFLLSSSP